MPPACCDTVLPANQQRSLRRPKKAPSARVLTARASKLPTTQWQDAGDKVRQPPARSRPCGWWMRLRQPRAIAQALVGLDHLVTLIVTIHPRRPVLADNVRPAVQLIHSVGIHGHSATTMPQVLHRCKISPRIAFPDAKLYQDWSNAESGVL